MQIVEYSGGGSCSTYGGGDLENTDRPEEFMESLNNGPKITSGPECMEVKPPRDITAEFLVKSKLRDLNAACKVRIGSYAKPAA